MADTVLKVDRASKRFGGVQALLDVSLTIERGMVHGLIGPNGAGKTTLFNVITGLYKPDAGHFELAGKPYRPQAVHEVARAGIARTFQNIRLFAEMTALENVMVARHTRTRCGVFDAVLRTAAFKAEEAATAQRARELLDEVGIGRYADARARTLSYGDQRRLEIARALAIEPTLIALDEPAAGMNATEKRVLIELIERIRAHPGLPLFLDIQRGSDTLQIEVRPDSAASDRPGEAGRAVGRIGAGISGRVAMIEVRYGPIESVGRAMSQTWDMSIFSLRMLGKMVVGELSWRNLSGPVAIADYAGQSSRVGWYAYVAFLALISISLGVLNLLPIPVLDGGHLVYYGLEAIKGRPLSERFLQVTQKAGLVAIVGLMVVALFNDLSRLFGG